MHSLTCRPSVPAVGKEQLALFFHVYLQVMSTVEPVLGSVIVL